MVYVGYPVNILEALRLFDLTFNETLISHYHFSVQCKDFINREIKKYGIEFHCLDKNLFVIGFNLEQQFGCCDENHISIDESIIILLEYKLKIKEALQKANVDLSSIEITHMEGEDIIMNNPEPFLINYSY